MSCQWIVLIVDRDIDVDGEDRECCYEGSERTGDKYTKFDPADPAFSTSFGGAECGCDAASRQPW